MGSDEILFYVWSLAIGSLATWQVVELWNHAEIFSEWRARVENHANFFARLLSCPQCLSVWVGAGWALLLLVPWPWPLAVRLLHLFAVMIATSRLANFANDWSKVHARWREPMSDPK